MRRKKSTKKGETKNNERKEWKIKKRNQNLKRICNPLCGKKPKEDTSEETKSVKKKEEKGGLLLVRYKEK